MDNILYIDDYINLYNKTNKQLLIVKPYKKTLHNGLIKDREKFIKKMNDTKEKYKLNDKLFEENICVIINKMYNKESKFLIKSLLEELNYKNVKFKNELDYIKINKKTVYINYNTSYFYLLYTDSYGDVKISLYDNNEINRKLIIFIIKEINKKEIIVYGKNYKEIINIFNKTNINYYYFENSENLVINFLVNENKV